jgi:hypothetical protein
MDDQHYLEMEELTLRLNKPDEVALTMADEYAKRLAAIMAVVTHAFSTNPELFEPYQFTTHGNLVMQFCYEESPDYNHSIIVYTPSDYSDIIMCEVVEHGEDQINYDFDDYINNKHKKLVRFDLIRPWFHSTEFINRYESCLVDHA